MGELKKHEKFKIHRQFRNSMSTLENHNKRFWSSDQSPKLEGICYNKLSPHPTYVLSMYMLFDSEDTIVLLWALFATCFWHSLSYGSEKENVKIIDKKNLKRGEDRKCHLILSLDPRACGCVNLEKRKVSSPRLLVSQNDETMHNSKTLLLLKLIAQPRIKKKKLGRAHVGSYRIHCTFQTSRVQR